MKCRAINSRPALSTEPGKYVICVYADEPLDSLTMHGDLALVPLPLDYAAGGKRVTQLVGKPKNQWASEAQLNPKATAKWIVDATLGVTE